jgi:undecaprenyl-diphosphatase
MTYEQALLYGAVQGVTEYLPVSSSAHLILLPRFLNTEDPGLSFDVFLHLGTLLATLGYFWRDWLEILRNLTRPAALWAEPAHGASWKTIAIGTVPALIAGALLHHAAETVLRDNGLMVVTLAVGGILLYAVDLWMPQSKTVAGVSPRDALGVGLMQCLALMPGMSRSGSTMIGGRLLKLDRAAAARFSFLLSAPITAAAIVFELRKWPELMHGTVGIGPLVVAGLSSFLFGVLAIGGLLRMLRRFGYLSFAIYRVALAMAIYRILGV